MPTAADAYKLNIEFFASLALRTGTVKLEFNTKTGRFSIANRALFRTIGNAFRDDSAQQSVLNDRTFHDPIVEVFRAAALHNMDILQRRSAYEGLATLRRQYTQADKAASLQRTLADIRQYAMSALEVDMRARFESIRPEEALGPLEIAFMDIVWAERAALFKLLDKAETVNPDDPDARPYASLANAIYRLYGRHIEPEIVDKAAWAAQLPALMGPAEAKYYHLQHNNVNLPAAHSGEMVSNGSYASDFVYYTTAHHIEGEDLWRVYLNFDSSAAPAILNHLWNVSAANHIHSFKIGGPGGFHTRSDKIVIYVSLSGRQTLINSLVERADAFRLKDPVPGMTIRIRAGIAKGIEPGPLDLGFSVRRHPETRALDFNPAELRRQSYGSIRAQLIAAALTQMHAVVETDRVTRANYRSNKDVFLKWVAMAFESYRAELRTPPT